MKHTDFDKYDYYRRAVQAPDVDVRFIRDTFKKLKGIEARTLREDFCGTFSICCEWVKLNKQHQAFGIDLDPEPILYGTTNYLPKLNVSQRDRVKVQKDNVLSPDLPHTDIVCAMNFSHYVFKSRELMRSYFKNCFATLNSGGLLLVDSFGGSQCQESNEDIIVHKGFRYFWEQASFDPISNEAVFHIHFKRDGEKKRDKVFSYDWRMWTIPELRELMLEAGFRKTHVYWEGTTKSGSGNGIFKRAEKGEECQAWIAYVVGEK